MLNGLGRGNGILGTGKGAYDFSKYKAEENPYYNKQNESIKEEEKIHSLNDKAVDIIVDELAKFFVLRLKVLGINIKTTVDLDSNSVISINRYANGEISYSLDKNTLTIQEGKDALRKGNNGVATKFALTKSIKNDGLHSKLVVTVEEKSGNFDGWHNIGFAISDEPLNDLVDIYEAISVPRDYDIEGMGYIVRKYPYAANQKDLRVGDKLEFDIVGKKELYLGGLFYAGNNGKMTFSFELKD